MENDNKFIKTMTNKKQHSLVRTIYLYLFTLIGLMLLTVGGVRFVDMGLKAFIFTKAEEEQKLIYRQPPMAYSIERVEELQSEEALSEEEKTAIKQWLADYKEWQEKISKINYIDSRRHREASSNLATIVIGLPLYLYHWGLIKKEVRRREEKE